MRDNPVPGGTGHKPAPLTLVPATCDPDVNALILALQARIEALERQTVEIAPLRGDLSKAVATQDRILGLVEKLASLTLGIATKPPATSRVERFFKTGSDGTISNSADALTKF